MNTKGSLAHSEPAAAIAHRPVLLSNVTAFLANNSRRLPRRLALVHGSTRYTFRKLEDRVAEVAGALEASGIVPGQMAGLSVSDGTDHVIILLALMRAGAIILPMESRWTGSERERLFATFRPDVVVTDDAGLRVQEIRTLLTNAIWMTASKAALPMRHWATTADSPVLLSLSSGTTGAPKGPLVTHGLALRRLIYEASSMEFAWHDINLCAAPLYFGAGRNVTLSNLFMGATVHLFPPPYEPEELMEQINALRITNMFLVPTMIRRLLKLPNPKPPLFPHLRQLQSGGGILHEDELKMACERLTPGIINAFATTEAGVVTVPTPAESISHPASVGRPGIMSEVQIVDDEHRLVKPGTVGRVRYWTPAAPAEYHLNTAETAISFRDGWFYPGDMGRLDEDGYLYLSGRSKDMIVRGGINVYPVEIEGVLQAHPAVVEAAVVGWPLGDLGEDIAAFVTGRGADEDQLLAHCREHLVRYKQPKRIFFLQHMPRNSAGKIVKNELAKMLPSDANGSIAPIHTETQSNHAQP